MSETSSTFGHYGGNEGMPRHWITAFFTSSAIYVGIGLLATAVGLGRKQFTAEKPVDVKFVEQVVKEPPAPPPPSPKPIVEAKPPPPAVPKDMKVRKIQKPPPVKELVAPKEMPKEAPAEADPSQDKGIDVWEPDPAELEAGLRTAGGKKEEITEQVQGVTRAQPLKSNEPPAYPKTARNAGKTDSVTLKIRITTSGKVEDVQVVEGQEPFVTAAMDAVKKWRYQPAKYQGKPISVYRVIKIAFQLS